MKDFLKYTIASMVGTLVGLVLILTLGFGGLIFLVAIASKTPEPQLKNKSVLVFDLSVNIRDTKPTSTTSEAFQEALSGQDDESITLRSVIDAIDKASKDKQIVALYLEGNVSNTSGTGFATLKEVRAALERFKKSGKQIIAYDIDWSEKDYYLSSIANKVILNPLGMIEMNGLSSEMMFFAGALEKYGIGAQVIRVGKYKAAVEPFILTKPSRENREQNQQLLEDLWSEFLSTVGENRNLTSQQLQGIAEKQGVLMADEALKNKLVDKVAYFDEVENELKKLTGKGDDDKSFRKVSITNYAKIGDGKPQKSGRAVSSNKNQVAVIYAEGEIVNGEGALRQVGGDRIAKQIRELRLNDKVKAIVLRINSPGGSATAAEVIAREVALSRKVKPVVVSMGNLAASGGYWIAADADKIFAEPNTITGSIGVFGLLLNIQKVANNNGVTWDVVKTAPFADSFTISRPKTPQEIAIYQKVVNRIYDRFLVKVANARKMPKEKVNEIAQGRVWSGIAAQKLGLVDEIGGLNDAIQDAAQRAKLGENWQLEEYPKPSSLEEKIIQKIIGAKVTEKRPRSDVLNSEFHKFQEDLATLGVMNDPLGVYARLPFNLRIK